ncbi:MAG: phage tail tape measure protein, partial [Rhizobacter sp.]
DAALFSDMGVSGSRAIGGPVSAGAMYQVNERGPELLNVGSKQYLMTGSQGGSVSPMAAGPSTVNNINVAAGPSRNEVLTAIQMAVQASEARTDRKLAKVGV